MPKRANKQRTAKHGLPRPGGLVPNGELVAVAGFIGLVMLLVAACGGATGVEPAPTSDVPTAVSNSTASDATIGQEAGVTLYRSPT